ncbi:hypothetical protein Cgig2_008306 [Carnegiea gigantea]|uniref:Uncharacterized protein n=1 Tax=Carnegiea gigantea TaxID=171969 RepID=A0A9Q1JTE4_9CARY|nr:hypothetical protein Cgig2_008306 [Carnegiea gigantea]
MPLLIQMRCSRHHNHLIMQMITHGSYDAMDNPCAREVLFPEGLWFDDNKVTHQVTLSIKSYYRTPYTVGGRRQITLKPFDGMHSEYWQLLHHKQTNEGFLKRSRQSRLNRITGLKAGTHHTQGSVSATAIAKRMRKGGEIVITGKLFSKTHTKPKGKTFADDRSKATWSEKGTVYGLGNSVSLFYERPTNNATANKPSYTPAVIVQLQTKLDSMMIELNSAKNEIQQQQLTSREELQQKMTEQHFNRFKSSKDKLKSRNKGSNSRNE